MAAKLVPRSYLYLEISSITLAAVGYYLSWSSFWKIQHLSKTFADNEAAVVSAEVLYVLKFADFVWQK